MKVYATVVALALLMLGGCSRTGHPWSTHSGTFVFTGLAGEPDALNPLLSASADVYEFSHLYMSYLVESNDRGDLVPEIALRVPSQRNGGISSDGRRITYHH